MDLNKEYGRGNRIRKHINYSDEKNNDDELFRIAELDDFYNNGDENDYSATEMPKAKKIGEKNPERMEG